MKILHLLASPVFSGPAEPVMLLASAQRALGHQVSIAIDRQRRSSQSEEPALPPLQEQGLLDEGGLFLSVKSSPFGVASDVLNLWRRPPDVLHSHFSHDHLIAWLSRRRSTLLVRSFHAPRSLRRFRPSFDAATVPYAALLPAVTPRPAMVLPALVASVYRPAGDRLALRGQLGLRGDPLIGIVSTFQPSRRHELALDAFIELRRSKPGARLVLVGDGVLEAAIRAQVASLGLRDFVTFTGYLHQDEFVGVLRALDEVWILGLGNDFAARAAAQARACEVKVIAVDEGALPAYADAVVEPRADAIAAASGAPGRQVSLASTEQVARQVLELYQQVRR